MHDLAKIALLASAPAFDNSRPIEQQRDFIPAEFESFNHCDHLCVNVPDGGFTITARTSQGKRVTFHFGVYEPDGPPQFLDIIYHDNGTHRDNGGRQLPTFDSLGFGRDGGRSVFDTRTIGCKTSLICVLMEDPKEPANG